MSSRILPLNETRADGKAVVYVMSRDQRVADNHAMLAAQSSAIENKLPLVVLFHLHQGSGVRAREHFEFMLAGLEEIAEQLEKLNITFALINGTSAKKTILNALSSLEPHEVYFDFNPLHGPRKLAKAIAAHTDASCYVVDTHNTIPAWVASDHQEFAAHTFRSKVHKHLEQWLVEPDEVQPHPHSSSFQLNTISFDEARKLIAEVPSNGSMISFAAGEPAAQQHLRSFIDSELANYAASRNDISIDAQSRLSPYLHYGHISALRVALELLYATGERPLLFDQAKLSSDDSVSKAAGMNALFEEMVVRKELADNFCLYANSYTSFESVPDWAKKTLDEHRDDPREYTYSRDELEQAKTHDDIWNASQRELTSTGKMHGYLRMYWAKKVLEWSKTPEDALSSLLYLNDHYHIDGGDPNGYVGILWSIAGLHDRPWTERPIFGKIRYMNAAGLRRKFDVDAYINRVG